MSVMARYMAETLEETIDLILEHKAEGSIDSKEYADALTERVRGSLEKLTMQELKAMIQAWKSSK